MGTLRKENGEYNVELCRAVHRALNWRYGILLSIVLGAIGTLFLLVFELRSDVSAMPNQSPPGWFLQRIDKLEDNQERLQLSLTESQKAIATNTEALKHSASTLARIESLLERPDTNRGTQ